MNVFLVAPVQVSGLWPKVREFLLAAMATGYDKYYSEWDVKKALIKGEWFLWVAADEANEIHAAAVARFEDYPKLRVCSVPLVGGRRMAEWSEQMNAALDAHARQFGAVQMHGYGREGWCRVAGYREMTRTFVKELG